MEHGAGGSARLSGTGLNHHPKTAPFRTIIIPREPEKSAPPAGDVCQRRRFLVAVLADEVIFVGLSPLWS